MSTIKFTVKGSPAHWAHHYTARLGLALVPIPKGLKGPREPGWNNPANTVTDPHAAADLWQSGQNMGVLHSASGTASLDVDHQEWATEALAAIGIDLPALQTGLMIRGKNGAKPLYRLPDGITLKRHSIAWLHPTELADNGKPRAVTLFELRAGPLQDVLPPSIHPDTKRPYEWVGTPPRSREDIPVMPAELLDLWQNWDYYLPFLRDACPWAIESPVEAPQPRERRETPYTGPLRPGDAFRERVSIRDVLERNAYQRRGDRYLPPGSSTKVAGVRILIGDDGVSRAFSDHGSCALNDGHAHDSFSAFVLLEHHGNLNAAVKAAAAELGITRPASVAETPPAPKITQEDVKARWTAAQADLITKGCAVLDNAQGNPRQKTSLFELWAVLTELATENIWERQGRFYINPGGLLNLKQHGVTGRPADISARLKYLGTLGFHRGVTKLDPSDPSSQLLVEVPASPHDLPFMALTSEGSKSLIVQVPTWRQQRADNGRETSHKVITTRKARPKGSCYLTGRFRSVAQTIAWILAVPDATSAELAELRGKAPKTIRAHLRVLKEWGFATVQKRQVRLTMTWAQIREVLRIERENDPAFRASIERSLRRTVDYCRATLFGPTPPSGAVVKRRRSMLKVAELRLSRLADGEPISEVMRLAA